MGMLFLVAVIILGVVIYLKKKNDSPDSGKQILKADNEPSAENNETVGQTKVENTRPKSSLDPTVKNILIFI